MTPAARAFGLDLEAGFALPGLEAGDGRGAVGRVRIDVVAEEALEALADASDAERLLELPGPNGPAASIDAVAGRGFLIRAEGFGGAWVRSDGAEVSCAPADLPAWRWQRFLTGQVLPFAAVLQGLEVFHASAVVVDGRAVAIVAASGAGKTSLALNLTLAGLPFLNDDVLSLEAEGGGGLRAHPGPGLANVSRDEAALALRVESAGIGRRIGETERELRMAVSRHEDPVPLGAVFFVERTRSGPAATIERPVPVDPRLILAATFNFVIREPARLARQLEICGRIAETAAIAVVRCPPAVGAAALAELIHRAALELEPQPS